MLRINPATGHRILTVSPYILEVHLGPNELE